MENCAYHPERDTVGACVNCGKLVCAECKTTLGGKIYCNPCADKEFSEVTKSIPGQGSLDVIPEEVRGWNRGAFLLNWIWGIGNGVWIALLALIPVVGVIMAIVLGVKGSEWAWRKKRWDSIEHFKRTQRTWARWGIGLSIGILVVSVAVIIANWEEGSISTPAPATTPDTPAPAPTPAPASVPKPAEFTVSGLAITPIEAEVWEEVTVTVKITNIGDVEGAYTTTLRIDGAEVETKEITLAGETVETVTFTFSRDVGPSYDIEVDGLIDTLTIKEGVLPTYGIGDKWVHKVVEVEEGVETEYDRTLEVIGKDIVDGKDVYVVELSFDPPIMGIISSASGTINRATMLPLSMQMSFEVEGTLFALESIFSYEFPGNTPYPLELGKEWQEIETETMTTTYMGQSQEEITTTTSNYKVERIEDITVPAGTFRCFVVVKYDKDGNAKETRWLSDKVKQVPVKSIRQASGATEELKSYSFK